MEKKETKTKNVKDVKTTKVVKKTPAKKKEVVDKVKQVKIIPEVIEEKPNKKDNYFYTVWTIFIVLTLYIVVSLVSALLANVVNYGMYTAQILSLVFTTLLSVFLFVVFKKTTALRANKSSFFNTLKDGWLIMLVGASVLALSLASGHRLELSLPSFDVIIGMIVTCIFVGLSEEFIFRGLIQNTITEKYGKTYRGLLSSIIISAIVFGFFHATDAFNNTNAVTVIIQIICASVSGLYFGAIYNKNKNIYGVGILHAIYNICATFGTLYFVNCYSTASTGYGIDLLVIAVILLLPVLSMLSKVGLNETLTNKEPMDTKAMEDYDKKSTGFILSASIILALFISFSFLSTLDYDFEKAQKDYKCVSYKELNVKNYEFTFQEYQEYRLAFDKEKITELGNEFVYEVEQLYYYLSVQEVDGKDVLRISDAFDNKIDVSFDENKISNFALVENNGAYTLMVLTYETNNSKVYQTKYITYENVFKDGFMDGLKGSFEEVPSSKTYRIGYTTFFGDTYKYPSIYDEFDNLYYFDSEGTAYKH